jgi:hypothetical protein
MSQLLQLADAKGYQNEADIIRDWINDLTKASAVQGDIARASGPGGNPF